MTWPAPSTLLRHRAPAIMLAEIVEHTPETLRCRGPEQAWTWPMLLEGCAQTAGLLAGLTAAGLDNHALIAEYRDLTIQQNDYAGAPQFEARFDRRILGFWRYTIRACAADGGALLCGSVTLAAGAH